MVAEFHLKSKYTVKSVLSVLVVKIWEIICWNDGHDDSDDPDGCTNNVSSLQRESATTECKDDADQSISGYNSQH